jgi:hypothetical protein
MLICTLYSVIYGTSRAIYSINYDRKKFHCTFRALSIKGQTRKKFCNLDNRKQIQKWVQDLSNTNEILERWLLVQGPML